MFTAEERNDVRDRLLRLARDDGRVTGAAITGSGGGGTEDRWSDIDLFFGVADGIELQTVRDDWTGILYRDHEALHHFDVHADPAIYRAFLLPNCLEVDLGFTPAADFGARRPSFRLVFCQPVER